MDMRPGVRPPFPPTLAWTPSRVRHRAGKQGGRAHAWLLCLFHIDVS